jgi:chromosome partitioning protein
MAKTICLFSQKGGAGKTTTAVNLAAVFALLRKRTLLVDCDPQGAATTMICTIPHHPEFNLSDVLLGSVKIEKAIVQGCLHYLKVVPAPFEASIEDRLKLNENGRQTVLKRALASIRDSFDYIFIDTPASDWAYIINAAAASDFVLLVLKADYLSFQFLGQSIDNIGTVKKRYNPNLKSAGIVFNMYDADEQGSIRVLQSSQKHLSKWQFKTIIPKDPLIAASPLLGKPLIVSNFKASATQCYLQLATELLGRLG